GARHDHVLAEIGHVEEARIALENAVLVDRREGLGEELYLPDQRSAGDRHRTAPRAVFGGRASSFSSWRTKSRNTSVARTFASRTGFGLRAGRSEARVMWHLPNGGG